MDRKPPTGVSQAAMDKYMMKKYRDRSSYFRPKREIIYVNGERQYVNNYDSLTDNPDSPFKRNYILVNASPDGILHVSRHAGVMHGWSPRFIGTNFSVPSTPKRCQSSLELHKSENYTSAEDLRYHAVRKAGSCDDILLRDQYYTDVPPSESGISVSDIDSIFCIDDDVRSQSSIGSADRSFSYSEIEEHLDVLDVINENEVLDDSGNQGSETLSHAPSNTVRHLSQGQIDAAVLTEELLKLKEAQEKRRIRKAQDVKAYIENNYPKRNLSSTSNDSCLGESIRTDFDHLEFSDSENQTTDDYRFKSRRKLTYSTDSALSSRHHNSQSEYNSDDIVTTSTETTYIQDLPGIYQHEKYTNNDWQQNRDNWNTKSEFEEIMTSVETNYFQNDDNVRVEEDEIDHFEAKQEKSLIEKEQSDSENVCESIDTVYFNDSNSQFVENSGKNKEFSFSKQAIYVSDENSIRGDNEELASVIENIQFKDQTPELHDDSSIISSRLLQPSSASLQILINEITVSDSQHQMSKYNLFTTENVLNRCNIVNPVNLNRADQNPSNTDVDQSEISLPNSDVLADDICINNENSLHYYSNSIDETPTHDTKTTVVVINHAECTSNIHSGSQLNIEKLTSATSYFDGCDLEGKYQLDNFTSSRHIEPGVSEEIKPEIDQDIAATVNSFNWIKQTQTTEIQYGENDNECTGETFGILQSDSVNSSDIENQFCDNVKRFEKVDKAVIEHLKEDTESGVDRKEAFIYKEVTRLWSNISKVGEINVVCLEEMYDTQQEITSRLGFSETFIDRHESIINQSDDQFIIRQNTRPRQADFSCSSIDFFSSSGTTGIKADYTGNKNIIIAGETSNMEYNQSVNRNEIFEEEEWDNPEDFQPLTQNGVKINVIKNKIPNLTKYKMQTISENEEVKYGLSEFAKMYNPEEDEKSEVISTVVQNNGIEISMIQTGEMNIAKYRVVQKENAYYSDVTDLNSCGIEETDNNIINPQVSAIGQRSEVSQNSSAVQRSMSSYTYLKNFNSSQEIITPATSTESLHIRNLTLGEIGNENMGRSFQFVRDRANSPENLETTNAEGSYRTEMESKWQQSTESLDIANLSFISDSSSIYQASCCAEINDNDLEESGYTTYLYAEQSESPDRSFLDVSHDSDSSTYRAVATAEVNIDIPDMRDGSTVQMTQNNVLTPNSEISDTESGYYTLTRSGRLGLSRQDTSEDMTSFISEEGGSTVYRAQMFGEMSDDGSLKLERAVSSEDITSFVESSTTGEVSRSKITSQSIVRGSVFHRINSQEDMTSFVASQDLPDVVNISETFESFRDVGEQRLVSRIDSSEDMRHVKYKTAAVAEISNNNIVSEHVTNIENQTPKKTVIEIFDSSEDLTGCIEFEIDDVSKWESQRRDRHFIREESKVQHASSTEYLSRNLVDDNMATSRQYSFDRMEHGSQIGIGKMNSSELTERSKSTDELSTALEQSEIFKQPNNQIHRVNSSEDMTSFEKLTEMTQRAISTDELSTGLEQSGILRHLNDKVKRVNSTEDMTSFEKTTEFTEQSQTTEEVLSALDYSEIFKQPNNQIQRVNSSEDMTSFEKTTNSTEILQHTNKHHFTLDSVKHQNSETKWMPSSASNQDEWATSVETTGFYDGSNINNRESVNHRGDNQNQTTITTTIETTTFEGHDQEAFDLHHQSANHDEVDNANVRNLNYDIDTTTRILQSERMVTVQKDVNKFDTSTRNIESLSFQTSTRTLEENLMDVITSETSIDHSEKFASMTDKDRNKIQMFIIYQDFAQMRERARLKRLLTLLTQQLDRLDANNILDKSVQLVKINTFLDNFLMNLKISENLQTFKSNFEKVKSIQSVNYYRDNTEMYELMDKFSQIIRELDMSSSDSRLNVKLIYCLNFLKTKTLDAQFDSLCEFVCLESRKEDMELLQNHLCLINDNGFHSRRLLKYLGRGFSQDMETIWKPKIRNTLQSVGENEELFFSESAHDERKVKGDKPCCEFHASDKDICAELELWLNSESVSEVTMDQKSRTIFMN